MGAESRSARRPLIGLAWLGGAATVLAIALRIAIESDRVSKSGDAVLYVLVGATVVVTVVVVVFAVMWIASAGGRSLERALVGNDRVLVANKTTATTEAISQLLGRRISPFRGLYFAVVIDGGNLRIHTADSPDHPLVTFPVKLIDSVEPGQVMELGYRVHVLALRVRREGETEEVTLPVAPTLRWLGCYWSMNRRRLVKLTSTFATDLGKH